MVEAKNISSNSIPGTTSTSLPSVTPQPSLVTTIAIISPAKSSQAAIGKLPLPYEVQRADKIFVAKVSKIGELIWSSPDGKEFVESSNLSQPTYSYTPEQLAPIELVVTTSLKGNLSVGEKLTILLPGAPGSKPYGLWTDFPEVGDSKLWFVGNKVDYRRGLGGSPLVSLKIQTLYHSQPNGTGYHRLIKPAL